MREQFKYYLVFSGGCHLFSECAMRCECAGCLSGPRDCSAKCEVPAPRGPGAWYCDDHNHTLGEGHVARSTERCYYVCRDAPLQIVECVAGVWDQDVRDVHKFTCPARLRHVFRPDFGNVFQNCRGRNSCF